MARTAGIRLVALVFDDPYKAEEARAALHRMGGEGLLDIDETALIAKYQTGKLRVSQDVNVTAGGQDDTIPALALRESEELHRITLLRSSRCRSAVVPRCTSAGTSPS